MATITIPKGNSLLKTTYYYNDTTTNLFVSDIYKQWGYKESSPLAELQNEQFTISHLGRDTLRLSETEFKLK